MPLTRIPQSAQNRATLNGHQGQIAIHVIRIATHDRMLRPSGGQPASNHGVHETILICRRPGEPREPSDCRRLQLGDFGETRAAREQDDHGGARARDCAELVSWACWFSPDAVAPTAPCGGASWPALLRISGAVSTTAGTESKKIRMVRRLFLPATSPISCAERRPPQCAGSSSSTAHTQPAGRQGAGRRDRNSHGN